MKQTIINYNLKGLDDLRKKIGDTYRARVGILGGHQQRSQGPIDNVTLGITQMYGSIKHNIPPRDFLDMPIRTHGREIVKEMSSSSVKAAVVAGNVKKVYEVLGAKGEDIVQQAFETGGFGQWPPTQRLIRSATKEDYNNQLEGEAVVRILIQTGQLRRSITSDVVKKSDII